MKLEILSVDFHRNGIGGAPFHVALFHDGESRKVAIVFQEDGHVAVLDVQQLAAGDIASGSNSWRGDNYEWPLRTAIAMCASRETLSNPFQVRTGFSDFARRLIGQTSEWAGRVFRIGLK